MYINENAKNELTKLRQMRRKVSEELRRRPEEQLMISTDGGRMAFFAVSRPDGRRRLRTITSDPDEIYRLAHFMYLDELESRLTRNIKIEEIRNEKLLSLDYSEILKDLPKHFELLDQQAVMHRTRPKGSIVKAGALNYPNPSRDPLIMPKEAKRWLEGQSPEAWAAMPYRENTKNLERKTYTASRGILCRSKSEAAIIGEYDDAGILFHCDEVIVINGVAIAPDFIGLRGDGKFIYHEHIGLYLPDYREKKRRDEALYAQAGIVAGDNLIFTYDDPDGSINIELIRATINERYFGHI